ncbi:iron-containing redox enzyme family protein [uncultured Pseudacidovorax sp.]|uniref:iron-containing redox enzyme family protein n=1 Tax=uncultured Pseudacidovorax sp. TaxID=679313 RepID=UPI0025F49C72|nr:iron-containing redox enzyme family protein [uncultured Pseudacidovorax sp.]
MQNQRLVQAVPEAVVAPRSFTSHPLVPPSPVGDAANEAQRQPADGARTLYEALLHANDRPDDALRTQARAFIERWRSEMRQQPCDLPDSPEGLAAWQQQSLASTGAAYQRYLAERKKRAPRRYFRSRSHALFFLRAVAPTKLVDGAWLYGLLPDAANPHLNDLVLTYIEELGDGDPDKNHVLLYRRLLDSMGIVDWAEQPDEAYVQGALQLSLAACTEALLPEVIGFNLGYEQLPLHLLITAYELDELGIDPTYFTLHVTVDNAAGGHAQRALRAAAENLPALADREAFWARVADGYMLSNAGQGTTDAIASFDRHQALLQVLGGRASEGSLAHSDYCRIEGRTVNQWLADPDAIGGFVAALERKGWLIQDSDPAQSRFWALLQGEHASMFGVFGDYELQVIYDWIRGDAAADGAPFLRSGPCARAPSPPRAFRHARRAGRGPAPLSLATLAEDGSTLDPDLAELRQVLAGESTVGRGEALRRLLGPAMHWGPAGLEATRHVAQLLRAA